MTTRLAATISLVFILMLCQFNFQQVAAQTPTPPPGQEPEQEPGQIDGADNAGTDGSGFDASAIPVPNSPPSALIGESLFLENCAPCHGQSGNSDGPVVPDLPNPPPQFSDPATIQDKSPAEYFYVTKFGRIENLMPPWGNRLSDEDIWHVAAYAWNLHTNQERVEAGKAVLDEAIADDANLLGAIESTFAVPSSLFQSQQEMVGELSSVYPEVASPVSTAELANIADYLRTLTIIPPWGATYRAGNALINGEVRSALPDEVLSSSLADLPVTLDAYIQFEKVASFETVTDADGSFRFEGLSDAPSVLYLLETIYLDVPYGSEVVDLSAFGGAAEADDAKADDASVDAPGAEAFVVLTVYETTDAIDQLTYNRVNWVVDYAPGEIIVGQILSIGNNGNRTVIGRSVDGVGMPVTIELLVPPGANTIQFQDGTLGDRYQQHENSLFDTAPVVPGDATHQIFLSYRLPVDGDAIQVEQTFLYPIQSLNLLIAEVPDLEAEASDLTFIGAESIQNIPYLYWQGQDLITQTFTLDLAGLIAEGEVDPRGDLAASAGAAGATGAGNNAVGPPASARTSPVMEPIIPILVGSIIFFLLAGIVIWPLSRLSTTAHADRLKQNKDRLTQEIARLDDLHEAGNLSDANWQQERTVLKNQLLAVARQIHGS